MRSDKGCQTDALIQKIANMLKTSPERWKFSDAIARHGSFGRAFASWAAVRPSRYAPWRDDLDTLIFDRSWLPRRIDAHRQGARCQQGRPAGQSQGARAAATGRPVDCNPRGKRSRRPPAAGTLVQPTVACSMLPSCRGAGCCPAQHVKAGYFRRKAARPSCASTRKPWLAHGGKPAGMAAPT